MEIHDNHLVIIAKKNFKYTEIKLKKTWSVNNAIAFPDDPKCD